VQFVSTNTNRRRGTDRLHGTWKPLLWVDGAHQSWKTAHPRKGNSDSKHLLPCSHTYLLERLDEGKHHYKTKMGGLHSICRDGKQSTKKTPKSNHLSLVLLGVIVGPTTLPGK
jgi:hypothetical protein